MSALFALLIVLVFAYFFSELAKTFGLPRVVGQLCGGLVLGLPFIQSAIFDAKTMTLLQFLSDIGIVLLFFFVGMQINLRDVKRNAKQSVLISLFNTLTPFVLGFFAARQFGMPDTSALIIGLTLGLSSETIAVDILDQFKLLNTKIGRAMVTSGAVDNILEFILISIILATVNFSISGSGGILNAIGQIIIFFIVLVMLRFAVLPTLLKIFEHESSTVVLFTGALIITLLFAITSDFFGLGTLLGALMAGVMVREIMISEYRKPWEQHKLAKQIHIISFGFLVPIFFVWAGLNVGIASILSAPLLGLGLLVLMLIGTIGGTMIAFKLSGGSAEEGAIVGLGLSSKGDVELAIAALALQSSLISREVFSALVLMALSATIIAPYLFKRMLLSYEARKGIKPISQLMRG